MQEFLSLLNGRDILFHMLNVAILFIAVRVLLYKPVRSFMNKRADRVAAELDEALAKQEAADKRQDELDEAAQQSRVDAAQAIAGGVQQGQKTAGEIVARAHKQAEAIVEQAQSDAKQIRIEAKEAIRAQAVSMAVEIAGKLLEREVRPEDHEKIIGQFLTKVG